MFCKLPGPAICHLIIINFEGFSAIINLHIYFALFSFFSFWYSNYLYVTSFIDLSSDSLMFFLVVCGLLVSPSKILKYSISFLCYFRYSISLLTTFISSYILPDFSLQPFTYYSVTLYSLFNSSKISVIMEYDSHAWFVCSNWFFCLLASSVIFCWKPNTMYQVIKTQLNRSQCDIVCKSS